MMLSPLGATGRVAGRFRAGRAAGCPRPAALPTHAGLCPVLRDAQHGSACQATPACLTLAQAPAAAPRPSSRRQQRGRSIRAAAAGAVADNKNGIQVALSELSTTQRRATITIPASMCQEGFKRTVENLKKIVGKLPGFREDKIPLSMLVTQCGGQQKFKFTVIEEIMTTTMPLALDSLDIIQESVRIASDIRQLEAGFDPAKPFQYDVDYETAPPLKWAVPYKSAEVTLRDNGDFASDTRTVDGVIRAYLKQKGFQRVVVGRGLQPGDACVMDVTVCPKGSSTPLTGLRRDKFPWDTEVDPIGLAQGMMGMMAGETRQFRTHLPLDYTVELWRGMEVDVTAKVHEIFTWVLPEFDDEFVAEHFGKDFSSAEDMRKGLMTTAAMDRVKDLDKQLEDRLVEAVVSCLDVPDVPASLVNEMGSTQYRNTLMQMLQTNVATRDELEAMLTEEAIDDYIAKNRKDMEDLVKFNLAVDHIFKAEGLALDETDIKAEMDSQIQTYKAQGLEYDPAVLRDQVVDTFKSVKVIEWLKDNVKRNVLPYQGA